MRSWLPAPAGTKSKPMTGVPGMNFAMVISPLDCTGCGSCVTICPAKTKALQMAPIDSQRDQEAVFEYGIDLPAKEEVAAKFKETTVKGSQFKQPLLEFSRACGGLRRDSLRQAGHPAVRRQDVHRQRHRLLLHLGRLRSRHALHREQGRPWPRLGELPVRGQRRVRYGYVPGPEGRARPSGRAH